MMNRNGMKVLITTAVLLVLTAGTAYAAPLAAEGAMSIIGPVAERMIVIAGAALLLGVWQKWRERRNKK